MQLRYLLSLLSNHRVLLNFHQYWRTHGRRPSRKHWHWNCAFNLPVVPCERGPCSFCSWNQFCLSLRLLWRWIPWREFWGEPSVEHWLPQTFSCNPGAFHVASGKRLSLLSMEEELGITSGWLGTWDNVPLGFDSTSWNSPEPLTDFFCSCIDCNCEMRLCIASWLSLNSCTENSSTRSSWALFISPNSWIFRIWLSRRSLFLHW